MYQVFSKATGCVEVSCDEVFDETNGSQVEQVDLDELDDEVASIDALRNMSIGDVRPKESSEEQDQPFSTKASPPTQEGDQDYGNDQEGEPNNKMRRWIALQSLKCHTQEFTKVCNVITPSTISMVTLKRG